MFTLINCQIFLAVMFLLLSPNCFANTQQNISTENISPQIISFIRSKQYDKAIELFKKLSDNDAEAKLVGIVTSVYGSRVTNMESVLSFAKKLPKCAQDKVAYQALLDAMKESGHQTLPEIVLLMGSVAACDNFFKEIRRKIEGYVTEVTNYWAEDIRNGEYSHIKEFYAKYGKNVNYYSLNLILPEIIKKTYAGNFVNVEPLLMFLRQLPHISNDAVGYPALYEEMKKSFKIRGSQTILWFAYKVKESIGFFTNGTSPSTRNKLDQVKRELPLVVQKIVWGDLCTVKNLYNGEYLYPASSAFSNGDGERQVFTWIPNDGSFDEAKWKFEAVNDGKHFRVINDHWQKMGDKNIYLGMDKQGTNDAYKRNMWATTENVDKREINWSLEPIMIDHLNPSKGIFYLREAGDDHYFYAGNDTSIYDEDRRRVFTLVGTRAIPSASEWEIDCAW